MEDRAATLESGCGEQLGEYDRLWTDTKENVDAKVEKLAEVANYRDDRKDRQTAAGDNFRNIAMNYSSRRTALVDADEYCSSETPQKARRKAYGEAHMVMSDAVWEL